MWGIGQRNHAGESGTLVLLFLSKIAILDGLLRFLLFVGGYEQEWERITGGCTGFGGIGGFVEWNRVGGVTGKDLLWLDFPTAQSEGPRFTGTRRQV